jgi:hypothetical protein
MYVPVGGGDAVHRGPARTDPAAISVAVTIVVGVALPAARFE